MSDSWEDVAESEKTPSDLSSSSNSRPTRSTYVPPHLRNIRSSSEPAAPSGYGGRGYGAGGDRSNRREGLDRIEPEVNPFEDDGDVDPAAISEHESAGIGFDAFEDIPIETSGENVPSPVTTFAEMGLGEALDLNIRRCRYVKPTPVQRHAIPILAAGRDLMACAQTGSGKTAAFCFPMISGIMKERVQRPRGARAIYPLAVILSPTRELACQIHDDAKKFSYQTGVKVAVAYGGTPFNEQLRELERGVDILVATPGRLNDLVGRERVSLEMIRFLALDEANMMLGTKLEPQVRTIVEEMDMPPRGVRQTMVFSSALPSEIQGPASDFLSNHIFLDVGRVGSGNDLIVQSVKSVPESFKKVYLVDLLDGLKEDATEGKQALTLVFVGTKEAADALEVCLPVNGLSATFIHGDMSQQEREEALGSFGSGSTPVLVTTDAAARGLDIPHVDHVVNFDLPDNIYDYARRIARTGRSGKPGLATSFFNHNDASFARPLADLMDEADQEIPTRLVRYGLRTLYGDGKNRRTAETVTQHSQRDESASSPHLPPSDEQIKRLEGNIPDDGSRHDVSEERRIEDLELTVRLQRATLNRRNKTIDHLIQVVELLREIRPIPLTAAAGSLDGGSSSQQGTSVLVRPVLESDSETTQTDSQATELGPDADDEDSARSNMNP